MKKIVLLLAALVMVSSSGFSQEIKSGKKMPVAYQAVSMDKAEILQEGENKIYCPKCGMTLPMFYKTNHAAHIDGKSEQYCSIHCLAKSMEDAKKHAKKVSDLKVVDNSTLKFMDATKAWYVMGSAKAGTMSKISKYAFASIADAEAFAKDFGGKVMNFDDTIASVKSTLAQESAMVHKKQMMMSEKGAMMHKKMCTPTDATFDSVADAKSYLVNKKPCGKLNGKQLQAIGLYLNSRH